MRERITVSLLVALSFASTQLQAKSKPDTSKSPEIVAHIPLNSKVTTEMFTRRDTKGHLYLYAIHPSGEAVSVVDITNAERSSLVSQISYPNPAGYGNVQTLGVNTALVEMADPGVPAPVAATAKNLALLDTSNPVSPRLTLRFAGVTAISRDDSRSLVFIANNEGLWIVRHYEPPDIGVQAWLNFVSAP